MDPLFEIEVERPIPGSRDAGRFLYRQLKDAIQDGRLAAGTQLPARRKSAAFFGLSRNTVAEVYDRMSNEGLVVARHGSGTYVADLPAEPGSINFAGQCVPAEYLLAPGGCDHGHGFWRDDLSVVRVPRRLSTFVPH
jgi:GntR family transcriptional regulator/MocR family aminotransferase